jgi:ABC-type sugar transport system substrate-binding protein
MKKIVTFVLVLAMIGVLFAGCTPKTEESVSAAESPSTAVSESKPAESPSESAQAEPTLIGVSIMEMTAYTWFLGARDGCLQWAEEHPEANFTFQFEDSASDVQTMLNNIDNLITAAPRALYCSRPTLRPRSRQSSGR